MASVVIGGTLAAGGANAINMYVDRDIDDLMRRTRHRPLPRHAVNPAGALWFGVAPQRAGLRLADPHRQPAQRAAGDERHRVLRLRLHDVAEAHDAAEHRHRRCGRLRPGARRLGGGDRRGRPAGARAVRDRLLLDAAALLGAGAALPRRLRGRERADAAGGARRGRDRAPDRALHDRPDRGQPAPPAGGRHGLGLPRGRRRARRPLPARRRCGCGPMRRTGAPPSASSATRSPT